MRAATFDAVLSRFDDEIDLSRRKALRLGYFACLYRAVTAGVRDRVQAGGFDDGARMEAMVATFAGYYFDALDQWRQGDRPSRVWQSAFIAAGDPRLLILQHLLLGMNAHINLDLAVATATVAPGRDIVRLEGDFYRINDLLFSMIDVSEAAVAAFTPMVGELDEAAGTLDEALAAASLKAARGVAWRWAMALAQMKRPPVRRAAISLLDRRGAWLASGLTSFQYVAPELARWLEPSGGDPDGVRRIIDTLHGISLGAEAPAAALATPWSATGGAARRAPR